MNGMNFIADNKGVLVVAVFTTVMLSLIPLMPPVEAEPFVGEIKWFAGNFNPRGYALCDGQLLSISQNNALFALFGTIYGGDGRTTFGLPDMRGRIPVHASTSQGPGLDDIRLGQRVGFGETVTVNVAQLPAHNHAIGTLANPQLKAADALSDNTAPNVVDVSIATSNLINLQLSLIFVTADPDVIAINDAAISALAKLPTDQVGALDDLLGVKDNVINFGDSAVTSAYDATVDSFYRGTGNSLGLTFARLYSSQVPATMMHALSLSTAISSTDPGAIGTETGALANTGGSQSHNNMPPFLNVNCIVALQGIFPSRD